MTNHPRIGAETLDGYYQHIRRGGYQIRELGCKLCPFKVSLGDLTPLAHGGSNLGKVSKLRGAMREHLREKHSLQIALDISKENV